MIMAHFPFRVNARGVRKISVYAQFWMLNHTGMPLACKQIPNDPKDVFEYKVLVAFPLVKF